MRTLPFLLELNDHGEAVEAPPEAELALALVEAERARRKGGLLSFGRQGETLLWLSRLFWPWYAMPTGSGNRLLPIDGLGLFSSSCPAPERLVQKASGTYETDPSPAKDGPAAFCARVQSLSSTLRKPQVRLEKLDGVAADAATLEELLGLWPVASERPESWSEVWLPEILGQKEAVATAAKITRAYQLTGDERQGFRLLLNQVKQNTSQILASLTHRRAALEDKLREHSTDGQMQLNTRTFTLREGMREAVESVEAPFHPLIAKLNEELLHWKSEVKRLEKETEHGKLLAQAQKAVVQTQEKLRDIHGRRDQGVQEAIAKSKKAISEAEGSFKASAKATKRDIQLLDAQIKEVRRAFTDCQDALTEKIGELGALREQLASMGAPPPETSVRGHGEVEMVALPVWVACYRTPTYVRHRFFLPVTLLEKNWRHRVMGGMLPWPVIPLKASLPSLQGTREPSILLQEGDESWWASFKTLACEGDFLRRPSFDLEMEGGLAYLQARGWLAAKHCSPLRNALEAYTLTAERLRAATMTPEGPRDASADLKGALKQGEERLVSVQSDLKETQQAYLCLLRQLHEEVRHRRSPGVELAQSSFEVSVAEAAKRLGLEERRFVEVALLSDIGLLFLPEALVQRDLPLSFEDRRKLESHVDIGNRLLNAMGYEDELATVVMTHHENYDGSGYPQGLVGEGIPLGGRILRALDYFYELVTPTFDRRALDREAAVLALSQAAGTLLDPTVVEVLTHFLDANESSESGAAHAIYTVSHELRSPLTFLLGFAELLKDRKDLPPDVKAQVGEIHGEAVHMTRLIQKLLDVSRFETGNVHLVRERVELGSLVRQAIEKRRATSDGRSFECRVPPQPITIIGDEDRLSEVVDNLLENAVRYSPDNSPILVEARPMDNGVLVKVQDHGIGIAKEDQPKVFEKFFRGQNARTRVAEGSGLGLSLCLQIVEGHGGKIWFESEIGKGTTFFFLLPMAVSKVA